MKNFLSRINQWFQEVRLYCQDSGNRWLVFSLAVIGILALRAAGYASFATLMALIYIMYFVSAGRDR